MACYSPLNPSFQRADTQYGIRPALLLALGGPRAPASLLAAPRVSDFSKISEIGAEGEVVITKQKGRGGIVSVETCTAQLLYEIQGPWYINSDVTAIIDNIRFTQIGENRVSMSGVESAPPPPTTKVGITAHGGFQAEMHYFLVGLDIPAKARMFEQQLHAPPHRRAGQVRLRPRAAQIPPPIVDLVMSSYPGGTFHLDMRLGIPRPVYEYFVTKLDQTAVEHRVHMHDGRVIEVPPPSVTKIFATQQPSAPSFKVEAGTGREWGETVRAPLGLVVGGRSGDKGSDANVGFFVSSAEQYEWLRQFLSVDRMKTLLAKEYNGKEIDRFELPHINAVHFLLHDHLDRGVSCTTTVDFLGKNVAEFIRAREVDVPRRSCRNQRTS
ncbi:hypothetical protein B0H16DRAFT_1901111 [Mycena metata]|uniref:Uncharacterized protein n=1 Tax=Mycena metata TaxID=1033252 RepID=A0AAD7MB64_9AGAR|nr:hypothetical protein B0H16DRAFT_1901111 [Mycena metata]